MRIADHRIIAEHGLRVDVVAQIERQLDGVQALLFRASRKGAGRLAFPVVETCGGNQRRPAGPGFQIGARATVEQELHDPRLARDDRAVQRRAATPTRIAQHFALQLFHVQRIVQQHVAWIPVHFVVAEIGGSIDVVAKIQR